MGEKDEYERLYPPEKPKDAVQELIEVIDNLKGKTCPEFCGGCSAGGYRQCLFMGTLGKALDAVKKELQDKKCAAIIRKEKVSG